MSPGGKIAKGYKDNERSIQNWYLVATCLSPYSVVSSPFSGLMIISRENPMWKYTEEDNKVKA